MRDRSRGSLVSHTELCELKPYVTSILEIWTQMSVEAFFQFLLHKWSSSVYFRQFCSRHKTFPRCFQYFALESPHVGAPVYAGWGNSSSGAPPEQEEELTSAEWGFYEVLIGGVAATHKSCHRNADLTFPGEAGHRAPTEELAGHLTSLESWPRTSVRRQPSSRQKGKGCVFKTAARKSISGQ